MKPAPFEYFAPTSQVIRSAISSLRNTHRDRVRCSIVIVLRFTYVVQYFQNAVARWSLFLFSMLREACTIYARHYWING